MKARHALLAVFAIVLLMLSCSSGGDDPPGNNAGTGGMSTVGGNGGTGLIPIGGSSGGMGGTSNMCPTGMAPCANGCVNVVSDPNNCGACGSVCTAPQTCANNSCTCPPGSLTCPTGCFDGMNDEANCGTCGKACAAGELCTSGMCQCQPGQMRCTEGGACTDTMSNPMNCGACGMVCGAATPFCQQGSCSATCTLTICGTAPNQTCINVMGNDPTNCGMCGKTCPTGQSCTAGSCGCPSGQTDCNGTCINLMGSDTNNCGMCGKICPQGQACNAGTCGCAPGQKACGTPPVCVDTATNLAHCGDCNRPCTGACSGGMCAATGGRPTGCPAAVTMLSDFEEGTGTLVQQAGRTGYWYVFADPTAGGSLTPAVANNAPVAAAMLPNGDSRSGMCNRYAMRAATTGHRQYAGFGATFVPGTTPATKMPYSLAMATGIRFWIRSNTGTAPPIWFEVLTRENQPGPPENAGTATNLNVDMYNTRGKLLTNVGTTWQQITVPFATMGPRYLPSASVCTGSIACEPPAFNPATALGFQFSLYEQFSSSGAFDLWVDEVELVTGDTGLPTIPQATGNFKFPLDSPMTNGCVKPAGATGKYLVDAFQLWKTTFVTPAGNDSQGRPMARVKFEMENETVSEGIAYGMLIAVFMNDKPLFDQLLAYWRHNGGPLMTWRIGGRGGEGSASDADEDAAFALIQAEKQWGGYVMDRDAVLNAFVAQNIAPGDVLKPGNRFGGPDITNPSYFAPAFYRVFAGVAGQPMARWTALAGSVHAYLNQIESRVTNGLVPAWCQNGCTQIYGGGQYSDGHLYQYDSHRTPWRMALDACWNNNMDARSYVASVTGFFSAQGANGVGRIPNTFTTSGTAAPGAVQNSMSLIGTAAVGAMVTAGNNAEHMRFLNRAWRFLLDANAVGTYATPTAACTTAGTPCYETNTTSRQVYNYYNATVGLLTALTMTGNFNNFN